MRHHKLPIIVVLLLCTLLWGTAVAAHQHGDGDSQQCEISLLPHAADVAKASDFQPIPLADSRTGDFSDQSHKSTFTPAYRGRAPPA